MLRRFAVEEGFQIQRRARGKGLEGDDGAARLEAYGKAAVRPVDRQRAVPDLRAPDGEIAAFVGQKKSKHPQDSPFPARPVANGRADRAALFSERVARSGSFLYGTFDAASGTFSHLPARGSANGRRMRAACAISCAAVLCAPSLTYFRIAKYFMRLFYVRIKPQSFSRPRRGKLE